MNTGALYSRREFFAYQFVNKLAGAFMSFRRFGQKVRSRISSFNFQHEFRFWHTKFHFRPVKFHFGHIILFQFVVLV